MDFVVYSKYEDDTLFYNHATKAHANVDGCFWHYHDVSEILFVKSGNITYRSNDKSYDIPKNTLIFTKAYEQHCINSNDDSDYVRHNLLFNEKLLPFDIYDKFPENLYIINFDNNDKVINLFEKMDFYCNKLSGDILRRTLINLIEEVFLNILIENNTTLKNPKLENNSILIRAIHYIEEHLLEIKNIEEICEELYISKSHLHHLFIEHLNISPKKYIITKRLTVAQRKICQGKKTTEVAEKCGFYDYSAFYRAYRKHFGYSPTETPRILITRVDFEDIVKSYN